MPVAPAKPSMAPNPAMPVTAFLCKKTDEWTEGYFFALNGIVSNKKTTNRSRLAFDLPLKESLPHM
jgi:hypothetical protein